MRIFYEILKKEIDDFTLVWCNTDLSHLDKDETNSDKITSS